MYEVIISDEAKLQIGQHIAFIAKVNADAAVKTKERILKIIRSLEENPERYPFFDVPYIQPNKYHKCFVEKWYLILYQIKDNCVYVDYVIDCRKDYQWLV
jgi:plasmid stabilization system protein ParE